MKNKFLSLELLIGTFSLLILFSIFVIPTLLKLREVTNYCQIPSEEPFSLSVQPNQAIYNKVFNKQQCSPHQVILRVPVNASVKNNSENSLQNKQNHPSVSTIVTFSNLPNTFYIRRIDQLEDGFYFSEKDSCSAVKWSQNEEQSILTFSMERNLLINSENLKGVIFIVSLPLEFQESKPEIIIDKFTWNRIGDSKNFSMRNHPKLSNALSENDREKENKTTNFTDGGKVNENIASELDKLIGNGGFYYDKYVQEIMSSDVDITKYNSEQNSGNCALPKDWN